MTGVRTAPKGWAKAKKREKKATQQKKKQQEIDLTKWSSEFKTDNRTAQCRPRK
jgi:hypothetical protein